MRCSIAGCDMAARHSLTGYCGKHYRRWYETGVAQIDRRRYPYQSLADAVNGGMEKVAIVAGVDKRTVYRWQVEGLTWLAADRAAIAHGLHPALVWPEWLPSEVAA